MNGQEIFNLKARDDRFFRAAESVLKKYRITRRRNLEDGLAVFDITGGTLTGVAEYLKAQNPAVRVVAVEPVKSAVLEGGAPGPHGLQGIGAGFVPDTLNTAIYDEVIPVTDEEAFAARRALVRLDGVLAGISSGAALHAATVLARREENAGKLIVALLPDTGERYLQGAE